MREGEGDASFLSNMAYTCLLLLFPPSSIHIGMIYDQFFDFSRQLNVNVMAYEYSGYGKATGSPTEQACYADIDAAFKYLVEVGR